MDMMRVRFFSMAKTDSNTSHHHIMLSRTGKNVSAICGVVEVFPFPTSFSAQNAEKMRRQDVKGSHEEQLEQL